jgi:hypothetical protein
MLYEKSYRKAAQERRAAKKAKRQERKKARI